MDDSNNLIKKIICVFGAKRFRIKQVNTKAFHDLDENIELATFNFNTGISEATWYSPFELVFGRSARAPGSEPIENEDLAPTYKAYMETLITRINYLENIARESLFSAKII